MSLDTVSEPSLEQPGRFTQSQTPARITEPLDRNDLAVVVVGGYEYTYGRNYVGTVTVRELARRYRVLNLNSEAHGSILGRLRGRAQHMGGAEIARTLLGATRPRRVEERLWLAPVRGLAAIGPLSVPEAMRRRNVRTFTKVIRGWLDEIGAENCVLLFYWWALPELVQSVPHAASIYDCTDDWTAIPGAFISPHVVSRLEGRLLDSVDRSYVVSSGLLEHRAGPGREISVLPNGFDLRFFRKLKRAGFAVPEALRSIPRPIVGYAGGLRSRMDWKLVMDLVRRRAEWSFVFVGGDPRDAPEALHHQPNVFFHRSMPYAAALGAISCFDVGTIPALNQRFSRGNSFLKLLDYFAHGIPVVAPTLPDTCRVEESYPGLLHLAEDADEWETALARAVEEPAASPLREARRGYVEDQSAERRVARMLGEALGRDLG